LWEWDSQRIINVVKVSFRLGIHTRVWKEAKGVVIPKPNKPDYGVAKAYMVITLFNCLGKVVEKIAANAIAEECERRRLLHDGQFGCRKRRSAIDAVGRLMKRVEEAWGRGNTAAVPLLLDVKGAFPHVAKGNLIKRMEEMGFEADLVRWVESFMEDRKVIMSMDGKEGDSMDVETGVPQGSPVSPVLFVIYLSGLFGQVERKKKSVEVRVYLLSMMWHGWGKARIWGNAHNDWRDVPRKQQFGQRRMPVGSTSKKQRRCCSLDEERIRN